MLHMRCRNFGEGGAEELAFMIESGIFALAKYFFTQEVSTENRFDYIFSTENMSFHMPDSCQIVTIANLYFRGYFPQFQFEEEGYDWWNKSGDVQKFPNYSGKTDVEVLKLIAQGKSDEEIMEKISSVDYYLLEELDNNIQSELAEYSFGEKEIDIKMGDFLLDNYDKFLMFVTVNHPTRDVLIEFVRRILKYLGIQDMNLLCDESEVQPPMPWGLHYVVYPSVQKAYGFQEKRYYLQLLLNEREVSALSGISKRVDNLLSEKTVEGELFVIKGELDFKDYMMIYIRIVRAVIQL